MGLAVAPSGSQGLSLSLQVVCPSQVAEAMTPGNLPPLGMA